MTIDPTTKDGRAYWQGRHDYEQRQEQATSAPGCPKAKPAPGGGWDLCLECEELGDGYCQERTP